MMRTMARPREQKRDLPDYLYCYPGRNCFMINPVTGEQASLQTKDSEEAKKIYWRVMASLEPLVQEQQQKRLITKLEGNQEKLIELVTDFHDNALENLKSTREGKPLADRTRKDYGRMLREMQRAQELQDLDLHDPDIITALRRYLSRWLDSPAQYNQHKAIFSRLFEYAIDKGLVTTNPTRDIRRRPTVARDVLIPPEAFTAITGRFLVWGEEWLAKVADLMYLVSHRPDTVLSLQESNISIDPWRIELAFTAAKNGVDMEIYDDKGSDLEQVVTWLQDWKKAGNFVGPHLVVYPYKFRGRKQKKKHRGHPISRDWFSRQFAEAGIEAGLTGLYQPRDLRKTGLTNEARNAGEATNKGGHKTEQMRQRYVVGGLPVRHKNTLKVIKK